MNKTELLPSNSSREMKNTHTKQRPYRSDCDKSYRENSQRVGRVENARFGGEWVVILNRMVGEASLMRKPLSRNMMEEKEQDAQIPEN